MYLGRAESYLIINTCIFISYNKQQYLPILRTGCKMVIIKNKGWKVPSI